MNSPLQEKAVALVYDYIRDRLEKTDTHITFSSDEVYVVWFSKTLQNWKALLSTTLPDGMYYEVTYNGDEKEAYIDAYKKFDNVTVPDPDEPTSIVYGENRFETSPGQFQEFPPIVGNTTNIFESAPISSPGIYAQSPNADAPVYEEIFERVKTQIKFIGFSEEAANRIVTDMIASGIGFRSRAS